MVDVVFLFLAAAAEHGEGDAEVEAVNIRDEAGSCRLYVGVAAGGREKRMVIDHAGVAALEADAVAEFFEGFAGGNHFLCQGAAFVEGFRALAKKKHPGGKFQAEGAEVGGTPAFEDLDGLDDLVG